MFEREGRIPRPSRSNTVDPPGRWTALAILGAALLFSLTTWFSATAVLGQLEHEWQLDASASAWLTVGVQLGFVIGALVSAGFGFADRVGARRLMLLGSSGAALANLLLLWSPGPEWAITLRLATGFCLAAVYPAAMKAISSWFRFRRGLALGVMIGALTIGSAAPHLVNGLGGLNWRLVIVVMSLTTVAGGLIAEFAAKDGPFAPDPKRFVRRGAWRAVTAPAVVLSFVGYFGHMWELYAMWAWFRVFLLSVLMHAGDPVNEQHAALVTFAVIGIGALGCFAGGVLGDRWGRTQTTAAAMLLSGSCALVIGFLADAPPWLPITIGLIWGFSAVADSAQFSAIATEVSDQRYVGTVLTLQLALGFAMTVVTVWLVPVLAELGGWPLAFGVLAIGPAIGAVAMLVLRQRPEAASIACGRG